MSAQEMENMQAVQVAVQCAAKLRRDRMGTVCSSRHCRFFFQIAYLPFKLYQNEFAWLPDPSEGMSLFNAVQSNQCFSSNCHLFEFGPFSRAMTLYHKTAM